MLYLLLLVQEVQVVAQTAVAQEQMAITLVQILAAVVVAVAAQ
jgi:hypothetical protein